MNNTYSEHDGEKNFMSSFKNTLFIFIPFGFFALFFALIFSSGNELIFLDPMIGMIFTIPIMIGTIAVPLGYFLFLKHNWPAVPQHIIPIIILTLIFVLQIFSSFVMLRI